MSDRPRILPNPFFVALLLVSTAFLVTCFAYLMGPYFLKAAAANPREAGPLEFVAWLDKRGPLLLGVEFVVMFVCAGAAMLLDHRFSPKTARTATAPPHSKKSS